MFANMKKSIQLFFNNSWFYSTIAFIISLLLPLVLTYQEVPEYNETKQYPLLQASIIKLFGTQSGVVIIVIFLMSILLAVLFLLLIGVIVLYTTNKKYENEMNAKLIYLFIKSNIKKYLKGLVVFVFIWVLSYILIFIAGDFLSDIGSNIEKTELGMKIESFLGIEGLGYYMVLLFYIIILSYVFIKTCSAYIFMFLKNEHKDMFFDSFKVGKKYKWQLILGLILSLSIMYGINRLGVLLISDINEGVLKTIIKLLYFYIEGLVLVYFQIVQTLFTLKIKNKEFKKEEWNFVDIEFVIEE